jgi:hypothetical protein
MNIINQLFDSAFILNDDTALLCLQLVALAFDETVAISFNQGNFDYKINLFTIFSRTIKRLADKKETLRTVHNAN